MVCDASVDVENDAWPCKAAGRMTGGLHLSGKTSTGTNRYGKGTVFIKRKNFLFFYRSFKLDMEVNSVSVKFYPRPMRNQVYKVYEINF